MQHSATSTPRSSKKVGVVIAFAIGGLLGATTSAVFFDRVHSAQALRERLLKFQEQHRQTVAVLSEENLALADINAVLEDRIADIKFMAGHASIELRTSKESAPDYDIERFLQRNPEAQKYFPYMLDAVDKYADTWPVDPMFALAILKQESDFGRHLVSTAGALGDAQFIESTARRYGLQAREPWSWKAGRQNFGSASAMRRRARQARDQFLQGMGQNLDVHKSAAQVNDRLEANLARNIHHLRSYYTLLDESEELDRKGWQSFREYKGEIELALAHAREIEKQIRERQQREAELIRISGIREPKTAEEKDIEVQLVVNDYLASVDPRLSPLLLTDALVHHLADLFREFNGDRRLVASRYNASRRAMEAAVASLGGGVGIPLLDETQDYVNRVVAYHAFFAVDGGVLDNNFDVACCTRYASR